jgi:hypothetical protein
MYPRQGIFVTSDRWSNPERSPYTPPADVVYPALFGTTERFLELLPHRRSEHALDLCSGSAVAALIAARDFAQHAYAYDICERSTHFGEFNRRLNAIENATIATSDLFSAAGKQTFDYIFAHPPYVPVLQPRWIYHDGGQDGEHIIEGIVRELPKYLRPGGVFYMLGMGTDRTDASYEERVRGWLGSSESEYDIAVICQKSGDPIDFAMKSAAKSSGGPSEIAQWKKLFRGLGITSLVSAVLQVQRKKSARHTFTVRRQSATRTSREELTWLINWETRVASGEAYRDILTTPLKAAPDTELVALHRMQDGDWNTVGYHLKAEYPFRMETEADPWMTLLLPKCDGKKTGLQIFEEFKQEDVFAADTPPADFARAVAVLVSGGFIYLASAPTAVPAAAR